MTNVPYLTLVVDNGPAVARCGKSSDTHLKCVAGTTCADAAHYSMHMTPSVFHDLFNGI